MVYKVIIVDDEKKIIQLIKQLGHWEEFGIEIIDECYDGDTALESIVNNKPDFVFSDIKMPGCDGIQLIEKVQSLNLETMFILLSGYRHFEYARSAIQLNVVDYLLKPIEEKQLNETIEKVINRLEGMRYQKAISQKLNEYEAKIEENRHEKFWEILFNTDSPDTGKLLSNLVEWNTTYDTEFRDPLFQVAYFDTNMEEMVLPQISLFYEKVAGLIKNTFNGIAYVVYRFDYRGYYLVINYSEENTSKIKEAISSVFYSIKDLNEIYGEFRINIGCSTTKYGVKDLPDAVMEAMAAAWGRLIFWGNKVLKYETVKDLKRFDLREMMSEQEEKTLQYNIKFFKMEELGQQFSMMHGQCSKYMNAHPMDMLRFFFHIQKIIVQCFAKEEQFELHIELYRTYLEAKNFQHIIKKLFLCLEGVMKEKAKLQHEIYKRPVEEAIHFINRHYNKQISLEEVANNCKITATYLSRLFKEEIKMGFSEYLTRIRIESSQRLLEETKYSIKEIADMVGYTDEKYYSKLFKKLVGIKPSEFRQLYG